MEHARCDLDMRETQRTMVCLWAWGTRLGPKGPWMLPGPSPSPRPCGGPKGAANWDVPSGERREGEGVGGLWPVGSEWLARPMKDVTNVILCVEGCFGASCPDVWRGILISKSYIRVGGYGYIHQLLHCFSRLAQTLVTMFFAPKTDVQIS